jgi:hypothetical protein
MFIDFIKQCNSLQNAVGAVLFHGSDKAVMSLGVIFFGAFTLLAPQRLYAQVPANWCSHSIGEVRATRHDVDINGDGLLDAICFDSSGSKWVALREGGSLTQRWDNNTIRFCSHPDARLFFGDVNGDRRSDLICKDPSRIWIDYGATDFFQGSEFFVDTTWCTHAGARFSVSDQTSDGRADLVCTNEDGSIFVDIADTSGRFAGTDFFGQCAMGTRIQPFRDRARPAARASAIATGVMSASAEATLAGDVRSETFVGIQGSSNAPQMPVVVSVRPTVNDGEIRFAGPPFLGYAQTGVALNLLVTDFEGTRTLCSDEQILNQIGYPGFNAALPLNPARVLSCSAGVSGDYRARVFLRAWATVGGAITASSRANVTVGSFSVRECRTSR